MRYETVCWFGEGGSIAWVVDTETEDVLDSYSTMRKGADWRTLAQDHADRLNRGSSRTIPAPADASPTAPCRA
jgi:hypothetical protein